LKAPVIEIDNDYIGNFQVQTTMKLDLTKYKAIWGEDWLPCCSGGFFDLPSWNFDKQYAGQKGIFDCTCRKTALESYRPTWNATAAWFHTDAHRLKP